MRQTSVLTGATATRWSRRRPGRRAEYQSRDGQTRIACCPPRGGALRWCRQQPSAADAFRHGDRDHLAEQFDTVYHAPEVGCNLLRSSRHVLGLTSKGQLVCRREKLRPVDQLYLLRRRGMLTSNVGEAYGFVRSRPELKLPDLELTARRASHVDAVPPAGHGAVYPARFLVAPQSRGQITLRSTDPHAVPSSNRVTRPIGVTGRHDGGPGWICARIVAARPPEISFLGPSRPRNSNRADYFTSELVLATCSHTLYHPMAPAAWAAT